MRSMERAAHALVASTMMASTSTSASQAADAVLATMRELKPAFLASPRIDLATKSTTTTTAMTCTTSSSATVAGLFAWAMAHGTRHILALCERPEPVPPASGRHGRPWQARAIGECLALLEEMLLVVDAAMSASTPGVSGGIQATAVTDRGADPMGVQRAWVRVQQACAICSLPVVTSAWADAGLVLAALWLHQRAEYAGPTVDPVVDAARGLLEAMTEDLAPQCPAHARRGLVMLAMLAVTTASGDGDVAVAEALGLLRRAKNIGEAPNEDPDDGLLSYWYAALLAHHPEKAPSAEAVVAATAHLDRAVRANYHPRASLQLSALLAGASSSGDLHAASNALQRCIEMDPRETTAVFNYALMLRAMGNPEAEYEMLELFVAAAANDASADVETSVSLVPGVALAPLFPWPTTTTVSPAMVQLRMARAAMDAEDWHASREHFAEFLALGQQQQQQQPSEQVHDARVEYVYVLLQCNRPTEALAVCEQALQQCPQGQDDRRLDLWMYRADALLCLERVDECHELLQTVLEPEIASRVQGTRADTDRSRRSPTSMERQRDLEARHVQVLTNLAVAIVCSHLGDVPRALGVLQQARALYPGDLRVAFNTVLLLWRQGQREAACVLWFDARRWDLRVDVSNLREQHRVLAHVQSVEDASLMVTDTAGASMGPPLHVSHVDDGGDGHGGVAPRQLLYVDALVLSHWARAQDEPMKQTVAQYVEYLEQVAARVVEGAVSRPDDDTDSDQRAGITGNGFH